MRSENTLTSSAAYRRYAVTCILAFVCVTLFSHPALADAPRTSTVAASLLPGNFILSSPIARQTLVLEKMKGRQAVGTCANVTFVCSEPGVLRVVGSTAIPVGNGHSTLVATSGEYSATVTVTVTGMDRLYTPSFRNDIQPILMATGCSSGACHGAAAGKNGFKLSLRGYDDEGDWRAITRHAMGRRIDYAHPEQSLFLLKPTTAVSHKGGERFKVESPEYALLADWIAMGTPGPMADDARIQSIEIQPPLASLKPGDEQQLIVLAHFSDGRIEDVTRWAKYTAADTSVATIDETGKVKVAGRGEAAIVAWYLSRLTTATVSVPYDNAVSPDTFAMAPRRNFVDDLVLEKLEILDLPPSPKSSDSEFLRRVFLDTIGVLPTVDETRSFLADASPAKRDKLIESLLTRPEFVDYWSYKWSDLLLVSSRALGPANARAYYAWVRQQVADNTPWDEFARRVVTATGGSLQNGSANFYRLHDDPTKAAETVSQAFLGMSVNCAKCHNHPLEKWTNGQYYGFANLFARVRTKSIGQGGNVVVFNGDEGDLIQPLTGKPQPPQPLDGTPVAFDDPTDRRTHAADWLVSRDNPYFTRAIVNRIWASFNGSGLVESVDDMRKTNPASNEILLTRLAGYLADEKFNLKSLMRVILQSETYQRSSVALEGNAADKRFYSHYQAKRLSAEVALDVSSEVTGVPTPFAAYPSGTRAVQLPDVTIDSYYLKAFGRPDRLATCTCERSDQPTVAQTLHMANGDTINQKLQSKTGVVEQILAGKLPNEWVIDDLYLSALCRYPSTAEKQRILRVIDSEKAVDRREMLEDLYWGLLTSNQFLFNH